MQGSGRSYWLVVGAEVASAAVGIVVLSLLDRPLGVLPWVSLVVGLHFVGLARVWHQPSLHVVGAALRGR